jgi:hypothetical protein
VQGRLILYDVVTALVCDDVNEESFVVRVARGVKTFTPHTWRACNTLRPGVLGRHRIDSASLTHAKAHTRLRKEACGISAAIVEACSAVSLCSPHRGATEGITVTYRMSSDCHGDGARVDGEDVGDLRDNAVIVTRVVPLNAEDSTTNPASSGG